MPERWLNGVGFERWYVGVPQLYLINRQQKRDRYQRVKGHIKAARLVIILFLLSLSILKSARFKFVVSERRTIARPLTLQPSPLVLLRPIFY